MTSATPKPRAGEHVLDHPSFADKYIALAREVLRVESERDALAAQNRELREAVGDYLKMVDDSLPETGIAIHSMQHIRQRFRALLAKRP